MFRYYYLYLLAKNKKGYLSINFSDSIIKNELILDEKTLFQLLQKKAGGRKMYWCKKFSSLKEVVNFDISLRRMRRKERVMLIEGENPDWRDLFEDWG